MKGFGFKQLKRKEGPSFYLSGFKEKRKRNQKMTTPLKQNDILTDIKIEEDIVSQYN